MHRVRASHLCVCFHLTAESTTFILTFIHREDCQHHSAVGSEELNMNLLYLVQKISRNYERHLDGVVTKDFYMLSAHK